MERYYVYRFDNETFVVADNVTNREVCLCGEFGEGEDAENRAEKVAAALNYITADPGDAYDASLKCEELFFQQNE